MNSINIPEIFARSRASFEALRQLSVANRAVCLKQLQYLLQERMEDIVQTVCGETGKVPAEVLFSDLYPCLSATRWYRRHLPRLARSRRVSLSLLLVGNTAQEEYRPAGSVLVISPWNFPFQLAFLPTLAALSAGCSVVLKPSSLTPKTGLLIAELFEQAGFPANAVQVLTGGAETVQTALEQSPARVFFTGSTDTGKIVATRCAQKLIPCLLELGGKAPAIILPDADLNRTARGITYGAFVNRGQTCVAVTRVLVPQSIAEPFYTQLITQVNGLQEGRDYGPLLLPQRLNDLRRSIQAALAQGARVLTGQPDRPDQPLVLTGVTPDMSLFNEECFAPVLCLTTFDTIPHAIELANHAHYGLSASVWGQDKKTLQAVVSQLQAGHISVNDVVKGVGAAELSFGGLKDSGWGRYHAQDGFNFFSDKISIFRARSTGAELNWFPYTPRLYTQIKNFLEAFYGGKIGRLQVWLDLLALRRRTK